jgi:hypothetical protein
MLVYLSLSSSERIEMSRIAAETWCQNRSITFSTHMDICWAPRVHSESKLRHPKIMTTRRLQLGIKTFLHIPNKKEPSIRL